MPARASSSTTNFPSMNVMPVLSGIVGGDLGGSDSLFVNASTWALMLTGIAAGGAVVYKTWNDTQAGLQERWDQEKRSALRQDLFSGKHEPIQVIVLKDLYELLEKVIDRCRDAGNVITHIVLKNS